MLQAYMVTARQHATGMVAHATGVKAGGEKGQGAQDLATLRIGHYTSAQTQVLAHSSACARDRPARGGMRAVE